MYINIQEHNSSPSLALSYSMSIYINIGVYINT